MSICGTGGAYKNGCRCELCRAYNSTTAKEWRKRNGHTRRLDDPNRRRSVKDDGIVDEVVLDRLAAGTLAWTTATMPERRATAVTMFAAGRGYKDVYAATGLRSEVLTELNRISEAATA